MISKVELTNNNKHSKYYIRFNIYDYDDVHAMIWGTHMYEYLEEKIVGLRMLPKLKKHMLSEEDKRHVKIYSHQSSLYDGCKDTSLYRYTFLFYYDKNYGYDENTFILNFKKWVRVYKQYNR
jgi:hypothetical protein